MLKHKATAQKRSNSLESGWFISEISLLDRIEIVNSIRFTSQQGTFPGELFQWWEVFVSVGTCGFDRAFLQTI